MKHKPQPNKVITQKERDEEKGSQPTVSRGAINESTTENRKNVNADPNIIQGNELNVEDTKK